MANNLLILPLHTGARNQKNLFRQSCFTTQTKTMEMSAGSEPGLVLTQSLVAISRDSPNAFDWLLDWRHRQCCVYHAIVLQQPLFSTFVQCVCALTENFVSSAVVWCRLLDLEPRSAFNGSQAKAECLLDLCRRTEPAGGTLQENAHPRENW